jgi:8-oxo-dGTP pyrophosphatase MutT (NUDIX family)
MPTHATLPLWDNASDAQKLDKLRAMVEDLYRYQLGAAVERIVAMLQAHTPSDDKETRDVAFIIEMCRKHPNILNMNCEPAHLTGSALVVHPGGGRVLLNRHRKLDKWLQFGGHFDYETDPADVALREAREESGISDLRFAQLPAVPFDIDAHIIPARGDRPQHWHLDLRYLVCTDSPEQAALSAESHEIRWLTFGETAEMPLSSEMRRMIGKAAASASSTSSASSSTPHTPDARRR